MPKRYICVDCGTMDDKKSTCKSCSREMEIIEYPWEWKAFVPYVSAGLAGLCLLLSYILDITLLTWAALPLIAFGLIFDHFYQKELDEEAREVIRRLK
ncbi:MAG: hypothetical protein R6U61_07915 [Thermoplasmata archaeon]